MPDADPQPDDVYRASPATSTTGDVHGDNGRPYVVVERHPRVALCVGRTTHPDKGTRTVESAADPVLGLTLDGFWQARHHRSVARKFWGTADFVYLGRLPEAEAAQVRHLWSVSKMLGEDAL